MKCPYLSVVNWRISSLCNQQILSFHQSNRSMQTIFVENSLFCWMKPPPPVICCLLTGLSIGKSNHEAVITPWQSTDSWSAWHECSERSEWLLTVTCHLEISGLQLTKGPVAVYMLLLLKTSREPGKHP